MGSLSLLQGIFPTQESNQGLLHRSSLDGPEDDHSEWSRSDRQTSCGVTYTWNLKCGPSEPAVKQTHSQNGLVVARGRGAVEGEPGLVE